MFPERPGDLREDFPVSVVVVVEQVIVVSGGSGQGRGGRPLQADRVFRAFGAGAAEPPSRRRRSQHRGASGSEVAPLLPGSQQKSSQ